MNNRRNIGYACITHGLANVEIKTCRLKNAAYSNLLKIIKNNLDALKTAIEYNAKNNIYLFRISSDIIPFASHPKVLIKWSKHFDKELKDIGKQIKQYGVRVSMHPGQYTVLNSPDSDVVCRSIEEIRYHTYFLDCLGVDESNKVILHVGGIYGDKSKAIKRFITNYNKLDNSIKRRLIIENDDVNYNVEDVLYISNELNVPVVFDNLHHKINTPESDKSITEWILACNKTWDKKDGVQKIHYAQQHLQKSKGAHSNTILINEFRDFFYDLPNIDLDIMLEVKDKNLSTIKCILCTSQNTKISRLQNEWAKYKYYVLGKYPKGYYEIRELLKDKESDLTDDFYSIIEKARLSESLVSNEINAAQHVFGYFKHCVTAAEKTRFLKALDSYKEGTTQLINVKKALERLAKKYQIEYLLNSYYFIDTKFK